uniref:Abhydro_lipase domain-containing protein n=1 Tax=Caenorhabditis japonica TaxID=281687 RepID=A0A8R1DUW7_CAEJA
MKFQMTPFIFLLFFLPAVLCDDEDTDMTATPPTIKPVLSTAQNKGLPKNPIPTFPFTSFTTNDWFSSMPTLEAPPPMLLPPLWSTPSPPIQPILPGSFPTMPTLAPFTFPTLPPPPTPPSPPTMKPLNITIDPEAIMDVPEIIAHWGYPVETHKVATADGYILTLHRIPHGKNETSKTKPGAKSPPKPVVFLQHGLLCTSSIWLLNLPHQSAGYIFADHGYDVWLGNMRGNTYSKQHTRMTSADRRFWKFSWEEMARHDLPAMIDYTLKTTKQAQLYYVGHSQGCFSAQQALCALTMFAKMSEDAEMSKKVRKFFAMAPVARMSNVKGVFKDLGEIYEQYNLVYQVFGDGEFLTNNFFTKLLTDIVCDQAVNNPLCENFIFAVSGPNSNQFNNMTPPEYDLRRINSSIYLFYSDFDWLANSKDVEGFLMAMLPMKTLKNATKLRDFNHNDFLWGMRARKEIYEKIIDTIRMDQRRVKLQDSVSRFFENHTSYYNGTTRPSNETEVEYDGVLGNGNEIRNESMISDMEDLD